MEFTLNEVYIELEWKGWLFLMGTDMRFLFDFVVVVGFKNSDLKIH